MLNDKTFVMIIILWQIAMLRDAEANDRQCCAQPDIQLTANIITDEYVQLKWSANLTESFGFCVLYQCDADDSVDYCKETEYCFDRFNPYEHDHAQTYTGRLPIAVSSNSSCCFWVVSGEYRLDRLRGCSKLFCCNNVIPSITMPEAEETYAITPGGSIICTATGCPEPVVEWLNSDGSVVDENTLVTKNIITAVTGDLYNVSVSMTISRNDAGNYTCIANNSAGDDIRTITVTVPSPPIITIPVSKQAYNDGGSITCTATGYPVPDIVWLNSDDSEVDESRLVTDSTMATDISNIPSVSVSMTVRWSDDGNYTCLANNSIGSDTSTVHIIVQSKPSITMPEAGETYTITEGGNITCTAIGYPEPDVEWMNNDRSVPDQNPLITKNIIKSNGSLFNVSVSMTVSRNDAGNYACIANNSFDNDISIITVVVLSAPIITMPGSKQPYYVTDGNSITCTATGNPVPDIVWLNSDGSEVDESRLVTDSTMATDISNTPSMSVSMTVRSSDGGNYICRANNSIGNDISTVHIIVEAKPSITMPEAGETYTITEGGNITCTAIGYPEPDVEWMNDDRSISDQNTVVTKNLIKSTGHLFNVSVSMTVSRNDAGNYTCIANNPFGNDISIITVVVLSAPIITMPGSKKPYYVTDGDNITCTATGNAIPDIVWLNSHGSEVDESRLVTNSTMATDISNIPSVSVSMIVRWSDGGNYTCLANNSIGNDTSTVHIIVQSSPSSQSPTEAEDSSGIYVILFCVIFILIVLLLAICASLFWCRKSKRKNTELEFTVKNRIERYLKDADEHSKDWDSEVEEVAYNKEHNDTTSITEDDALYILEMISHKRQTSLLSIMSIINSEECDDGIGDISESATTHYCNGGSAGSQSNTIYSCQRASCTSGTQISNDT